SHSSMLSTDCSRSATLTPISRSAPLKNTQGTTNDEDYIQTTPRRSGAHLRPGVRADREGTASAASDLCRGSSRPRVRHRDDEGVCPDGWAHGVPLGLRAGQLTQPTG